jgi:hypothetical protein
MVRSPNHQVPERLTLPPLPSWACLDAPVTDPAEAAFRAGAALAVLDARVRAEARAQVPFAGVWRRRLALKAAAASARIARRSEDEAMLRDAFFLRQNGADPGPAGRMLLAWRGLDRSTPLKPALAKAGDEAVLHAAGLFGLKVDDALQAAITGAQELAASDCSAPFAAAQTASLVLAQRPDAELLALWLADAVLGRRLKWPLPLPLLAGALLHRSLRPDARGRRPHPADASWMRGCCAAYAIAAAHACNLFDELETNSRKLLAVASRLRARGAAAVVEKLQGEDAVPPSGRLGAMSDRGLRRLFDRLVALGAVRELTGRPTFRLYGL